MNQESQEIFEKMERQDEVRSLIAFAIPDILIVEQWKTYVMFLNKCQALLNETLNKIAYQNINAEILVATEKEARFHLFNFYSCAYCIRQTMFEGKHFTKGAKEFEILVTDWKKEAIPRIAIAIRNKYQHGSLMEHILHYEMRTKHDPRGEGFFVGYNFEKGTWDKIGSELDGSGKHHLAEILQEFPNDPIGKINQDFIASCESISAEIQSLFNSAYAEDFAKQAELKREYDDLENWFKDRGMFSI